MSKRNRAVASKLLHNPVRKLREKGKAGWLGMGRSLLWSWWAWIAGAVAAEATSHGNLAVIFASVGLFSYLIAPRERSPRYGLDPKFPVHSHEFLATMVGATGVPFIKNNRVTILNNGDQFYSAMLEAIRGAKQTITIE